MNLHRSGVRRRKRPPLSFRTLARTRLSPVPGWAFVPWLIFLPFAPLLAGPPLETEDAGMLARGEWEVIAAAYRERSAGADNREMPTLDLSLGIGHGTQLSLTLPRIVSRPGGNGLRETGLGAMTAGLKRGWETDGPWSFAIAPSVSAVISNDIIPRHSEDDATSMHLPLVWSRAGERWCVFGQIGWRWQRGQDRALDLGFAVERMAGPNTRWLLELFGENPGGSESWHGRLRVGLARDLSASLSLLGSLASEPPALHGSADRMELSVYLGLQWVGGP